ncbi:LysR family transcriptional regulator [Noviherbaspirillum suwonense]|jgi:LysR family transcriptional activator of dmlA|uniref:Transcriptional regulator, LysR family n=1 Tax=Noviherbaspirillum suwonense TaxID=1224511 RepID=A0ABY1Q6R7_9BURK|nr:LysR family transcriptional regulator [Noviherbaspirillum suwonense]SMP60741.1 transcriptional regulator, LysR family [Noviherbaspirillum suwonense]
MSKAINPSDFDFFSTLVSCGSLAAAARELGISTPAVSKHLALMEERLRLRLMNRTTRRMSLTPEGETYLEAARKILSEIDDLENFLWGTTQTPKGLLRVNATLGFGRSYVAPLVSSFVQQYADVDVQLQLSVTPPPLSEDIYDVCVRFGPPPDTRAVARFLASNRRILCASPAYLQRHGAPKSPQDLMAHNCIGIRQGDEYGVWRFTRSRPKGKGSAKVDEQNIRIRGNLTTNDGGVAVNWALAGKGILLRAEWDVVEYIQRGTLIHVLPNFDTPDADIYAVYPQQHRSTTRVKAFVDFLAASFENDAGLIAR